MSDKLYYLNLSKEELAYLISLLINLSSFIDKMENKKLRNQNKFYFNSILSKLEKIKNLG